MWTNMRLKVNREPYVAINKRTTRALFSFEIRYLLLQIRIRNRKRIRIQIQIQTTWEFLVQRLLDQCWCAVWLNIGRIFCDFCLKIERSQLVHFLTISPNDHSAADVCALEIANAAKILYDTIKYHNECKCISKIVNAISTSNRIAREKTNGAVKKVIVMDVCFFFVIGIGQYARYAQTRLFYHIIYQQTVAQ